MPVLLTDQEKIDRAALYEEVRFYKKQQWAVAAAAGALLGAFLVAVRGLDMVAWEKHAAMIFVVVGVCAGAYFIDDLQTALVKARRRLDRSDPDPETRGIEIAFFQKAILVVTAMVVLWVLFKGGANPANSAR